MNTPFVDLLRECGLWLRTHRGTQHVAAGLQILHPNIKRRQITDVGSALGVGMDKRG